MKLYTARAMRAADEAAVRAGVASLLLMEQASRAVADAARQHWPNVGHAVVLCGKGNNGGDGYGAARHLHAAGWRVRVLETTDDPTTLSADSRTMRNAWLAHSQQGDTAQLTAETLAAALLERPLIVDALFGSGLSRPLEGDLAKIVGQVNHSGLSILSVDIPSGLNADSAEAIGPHVEATRTVQLAGAKLASVFYPARLAFGESSVADVGIPRGVLEAQSDVVLLDPEAVAPHFPVRAPDAHKYQVGTVLVVAGSARYQGAAELACRAALRAGAGLVTLASEARLAVSWPEIIFTPLDWGSDSLTQLAAVDEKRAQVRVIGPGLDERAQPLLPAIIAQRNVPTVLDAGALTGSDAWWEALRQHGRCVLTPHLGEAAQLLQRPTSALAQDPLGAARELAQRGQAVVVLKGSPTVVASPTGEVAVSRYGHPGMATGGTGDVLAGLLGAWCSELSFERVCATVVAHGLAGALAAETHGDGLVASDLVEAFGRVWQTLQLMQRDVSSGHNMFDMHNVSGVRPS